MKAWPIKGSVLWTNVLELFTGRCRKNFGLSLAPSFGVDFLCTPEKAGLGKLSGFNPSHSLVVSLGSPSINKDGDWLDGGQGDEGGRFDVQGTGWRAVKCFDPAQDHQRRKHWTGLDLPIKNECAVIEEDQIPS